MARPINNENRKEVQQRIMGSAREIFVKKGYTSVTMTELIEASGMSRGGFYFYYKSVDEVFHATIQNRKKSHYEEVRQDIENGVNFFVLVDSYFEKQKKRLLYIENSLLRTLYEYLLSHRAEADAEFRKEQKNNILDTVTAILQYGVRQQAIHLADIEQLAEHFMYTIEGLISMALLQGVTAESVNQQFAILKSMLK